MSNFIIVKPTPDLILVHHGIKGQRWGIRRFQDKSGALTVLGRRRLRNNQAQIEGPTSKSGSSRRGRDDEPIDVEWRDVTDDTPSSSKSKGTKAEKEEKEEKGKRNYQAAFGSVSNVAEKLERRQKTKLERDKAKYMKTIDVSNMTDKEIKDSISRMSIENSYKRLQADQIEYGRERTIKRLQTVGQVAATTASIVGLYRSFKRVKPKD